MALESFAFNVAQKVLEKLASKACQEISIAWGVQGELKKLEDVLMTVKAVLLDAEEKQVSNNDVRVWLIKLKDVLYDAEDVLDEFECETQRKQLLKLYGSTTKKVGRLFSSSNPLAFSFKMGHKIKQIREQLDEITSHKAKFHLNERDEGRRSMPKERAMTHSFVNVSDIIGRDKDKENIIRLLQKPNDGGKIDVIPIVGIGGLGKTALSKLVYNDKRVQDHFQLKMWVCVSEDFDIKNLIEKIIKCVTSDGENRSNLEVEQLQKILREKIGDKKYFLILDDVWNEDSMRWDPLQELLFTGANGSKILVTTRSKKVASIMGTIPEPYELSGLPHDKCVALFTRCAFKEGEEKHYPNLLKIGDKIVEKCKGVPLAVKTLASLLLTNKDENYWKFIRDSELWKIEQKENDKILPALRLSYEQLPAYLKKCFAYCSFYPKDYEYTSFALIQFWMAHGLLESTNENEDLEDIGWRYFQELGSRSFFQDFEDHDWYIDCKMHDLVHDLALSLTQNEFSAITSTTTHISKSAMFVMVFPLSYKI
ncbi:putative disease resistance protein RGA1 [Hevea brasiliensis]|uniref:putative disease resistance protein RGA1 n=1 Tax=Hevea brasiliensis TaxID=3981 RepID=UPI0025D7D741|nr:putative disease resistance protein RGA1 [Hevea brasiliensis]XP_057999889.1 putative disease resistance protein RGA1 [Hevea brasiliensis]XP_057999891.1 putative disease resistance protein RGA1 [Hevea brasiliensis]XP_057999892.1 putative disease resistance protein RGA1 [Hevea brasiliensis]XP_057999893.1 putative disease resistance protein RGA1 [Hevea brasiliensis]XP_057999894.1 putative disease resistance protein RGA1 [Hevea brasiliensis]XP_057999895.1 putative disease resistance protein RG